MKKITSLPQLFLILFLNTIVLSGFSYNNAFRFKIEGNNYSDETIVRLLDDATTGFDHFYDAYKLFSLNPNVPSIYTQSSENDELSINSLPEFAQDNSITIYTNIPESGTYVITFTEIYNITSNYKISLTDISSNTHFLLLGDTAITFTLNKQQEAPAFTFNISVASSSTPKDETCFNANDGSITIENPGNNNWNIELYSSPNKKMRSVTSTETSTSIDNLSPGNYTAVINSLGIVDEISFTINAAELLVAAFTLGQDTIYLNENKEIATTNNSQNAQNYIWDFDDGTPYSNLTEPTHQYETEGTYNITLTAQNNNCSNKYNKTLYVLSTPDEITSINENEHNNLTISNNGNGAFQINTNNFSEKNINLYNINGKLIYNTSSVDKNISLSLKEYSSGIYIINITSSDLNISEKVYR